MAKELLSEIFFDCAAIRLAEEAVIKEYPSNDIKTPVHLSIGAEAISAAAINTLGRDNNYYGTYRSHALFLSLTRDVKSFFGELFGKETGISQGKAGSMHLMAPERNLMATSAIVGSTVPLATGAALAEKIKKSGRRTICFFGDGAMEEGAFFESLNFAALKKLDIVFICEDNELAIHAHKRTRQAFADYKHLAGSFGIPYREANGSDPESLMEACLEIKKTNGPVFLHCPYHRYLEHVGIGEDYQFGYRQKPGNPDKLDPLESFSMLSEKEKQSLSSKAKALVDEAVSDAKKAPLSQTKIAREHII